MQEIRIKTDTIQLDQLLKWANLVSSGGEAKLLIQSGLIKVNDRIETRRGARIRSGDVVAIEGGQKFVVGREP